MELEIPLSCGAVLTIAAGPAGGGAYPTRRLQKGLLLRQDGHDLAEEGVGFGVPVVKRGLKTVFPGGVELAAARDGGVDIISAVFLMNLQEKLTRPDGGSVQQELVYSAKNWLAALIRRVPTLRRPLTAASNALRSLFGWETTYEPAEFSTQVKVRYSIATQANRIDVRVTAPEPSDPAITEWIVMNEQGAHAFDRYRDSDETDLSGDEIGCWDPVSARQASFASSSHRLAFSLDQVDGARLYRGRELIGARLAWAGFGYSLPPSTGTFGYTLNIEKLA